MSEKKVRAISFVGDMTSRAIARTRFMSSATKTTAVL